MECFGWLFIIGGITLCLFLLRGPKLYHKRQGKPSGKRPSLPFSRLTTEYEEHPGIQIYKEW